MEATCCSTRRLDLRGKQHLEYGEKYYSSDIGLRRGLIGFRSADIGSVVENIVYLELARRGWQLSAGSIGDKEVDFVARKGDELRYYQVCAALDAPSTIEREFSALEAIGDQWPKSVITYAPSVISGRDGIAVVPLRDFLLSTP